MKTKRILLIAAVNLGVVVIAVSYVATRMASNQQQQQQLALAVLSKALDGNEEINYGFHVIDGKVIFEGRNHGSEFFRKRVRSPVRDADPATFRALEQEFPEHLPKRYYGVDKDHVFTVGPGGLRKLDADPASFRLLDKGGRFASDKHSVFYRSIEIEDADPESFRRLKGDFSVDKNHAYVGHMKLPADASTFEAHSPGVITNVWHGGSHKKRAYGTSGWNRDANNIYYGNKRFRVADPDTFEDLKFADYAKDKNNVYWRMKIIEGADPKSFAVLGKKYFNALPTTTKNPTGHGPFARDKDHFYQYSEIDNRDGPWLQENAKQSSPPSID